MERGDRQVKYCVCVCADTHVDTHTSTLYIDMQTSERRTRRKAGFPGNYTSRHRKTYDELRDHVESLFGSVIENLTFHRMKKYFFCFYHLVEKIRSFPTMYNTWGCLWGQIDETKHFLQKSGLKTPILAATVLDHPTSKRAVTHNF